MKYCQWFLVATGAETQAKVISPSPGGANGEQGKDDLSQELAEAGQDANFPEAGQA